MFDIVLVEGLIQLLLSICSIPYIVKKRNNGTRFKILVEYD